VALPVRQSARRLGRVTFEAEADLALLVDVVDADGHVVAEVEHVLDPLDPLALADLGDVEQAIATWEDVNEGAELGDVHDLALVQRADLRLRWVEDQLDAPAGLADRGAVLGADGDGADDAVVVDRDVGAGLLLQRVDDLALRPDHLADLD